MLVLSILYRVSILTLLHTLRSRLSLTTRRILASAVVLTLGESISVAPVRCSILSSSRHSIHMEPGPSSKRPASIATESAAITASEKIFSRETILVRSLRSNAQTISSSLSSSESPARTTNRLITNLLQRRTFRPVLSSVKGFGKILANSDVLHRELLTLQSTEVLSVITSRNGLISNPGSLERIDLLSDFNESRRMSQSNSKNSEDDSASHDRLQRNTDDVNPESIDLSNDWSNPFFICVITLHQKHVS